MRMKKHIYPADIYLPEFDRIDSSKWACVACDQYTSERDYWRALRAFVGDEPSTLSLMLPEAYLDMTEQAVPLINAEMRKYLDSGILKCHENKMIYLERTQSDGRVRRGIIGAIDLEEYDYHKGAKTPIRATEGTVLDRIPPRVAIRRDAPIELPHIMILIDDPKKTVIEPIAERAGEYSVAYDLELMGGGGHAKGYFVCEKDFDAINVALDRLAAKDEMSKKYGVSAEPLLFAIGDGNHSLATAKTLYEEIKTQIGAKAARNHPARYALCEIVNLHDAALEFEPIYRVLFGVDAEDFATEFKKHLDALRGDADEQSFELVWHGGGCKLDVKTPVAQLAVGTVQSFLDEYVAKKGIEIDYVHGIDSVKKLCEQENTLGILFDGMSKDMLFKTVICDGALPRKTFSMGHAQDKRYYIECRKIK
ncbi:MAG: DUF1015 domain-containing protein [Ruminococcaceae bacterium]|nr:DUF1015 domain-containing protein [Oscillospiraceae bacterium]